MAADGRPWSAVAGFGLNHKAVKRGLMGKMHLIGVIGLSPSSAVSSPKAGPGETRICEISPSTPPIPSLLVLPLEEFGSFILSYKTE